MNRMVPTDFRMRTITGGKFNIQGVVQFILL